MHVLTEITRCWCKCLRIDPGASPFGTQERKRIWPKKPRELPKKFRSQKRNFKMEWTSESNAAGKLRKMRLKIAQRVWRAQTLLTLELSPWLTVMTALCEVSWNAEDQGLTRDQDQDHSRVALRSVRSTMFVLSLFHSKGQIITSKNGIFLRIKH